MALTWQYIIMSSARFTSTAEIWGLVYLTKHLSLVDTFHVVGTVHLDRYCPTIATQFTWFTQASDPTSHHATLHVCAHTAVVYIPWIQGMHCMPLDFPETFFFNRKYVMITQIWFKCLHKAHASSIFQRRADVWRCYILDIGTTTRLHFMVQRACAGNIYCMHADFKSHSGTLASNFTTDLMMAVHVTVFGENTVVTPHAVLCWITTSVAMSPIPAAARSKAWVCGRAPAGIVGSNPVRGMDVFLLWVFVLSGRDLSFRGVLPAVCLIVCYLETSTTRWPRSKLGCCATGKKGKKVSPYRFSRELAGLIVYKYGYGNKITMNVTMLEGLYDKVMRLLCVYF
jgi:hypothetical protein